MTRFLFLAASLLVLPLAALLFAQWPLRDLVQAFSRQANDMAQIVFALYMAVAVTAASRAGAHLAAGRSAAALRARWRAWALAACVAPWALFMLWSATAPVLASLAQLEHFGETLTPGFFIIKLALWLMVALVLLEALAGLWRAPAAAE
ncbi:MAG: C4-dicarboxylate ABC transporter substrate-binding protein [Burkholderiales bacterium]|nr:C4-dicarboxylate ABC transporter substrate-binding protein [Burkholderiales bacterium]